MINKFFSGLFYFALLFFCFFKAKVNSLYCDRAYYWNKSNSDSIKSICAISVIIHHVTNEIDCGVLFYPFQAIGFLCVAVFFFSSGFGLIYSMNNKEEYIKHFFSNRLLKVIVPYVLAVIVYAIYYYGFGHFFDPSLLFKQFVGEVPFVRNSWFVIVLLYFYFIFWFVFKFFKSKNIAFVVFLSITALCSLCVYFPHWSPAIIAFPFGVIVAYYKSAFDCFFLRYSWLILITSVLLFIILMLFRIKSSGTLKTILSMICSIVIAIAILSLLTIIKLGNPFLSFINKISFEMYLYHGLLMLILNRFLYKNFFSIPYLFLILFFTIILSVVFHLLAKKIVSRLMLILQKTSFRRRLKAK